MNLTTEQEREEPKQVNEETQKRNEAGEGNGEEMEMGELDLEGIEKACENLKEEYILVQQLVLFKESLIKTKGV